MATILPIPEPGDHRTGTLSDQLTKQQISKALGFKPNVKDDPSKVKASWGFTYDGERCGIWDYYGSRWSTFGPAHVFVALFGDKYQG